MTKAAFRMKGLFGVCNARGIKVCHHRGWGEVWQQAVMAAETAESLYLKPQTEAEHKLGMTHCF